MISKSVFGTASMLGLAGVLSFSGCSGDSKGHGDDHASRDERDGLGGIGLALRLTDGSDAESVNYTITRGGMTVRTGTLEIGSDGRATGTISGLDAGSDYRIDLVAPRTRSDAGPVAPCEGSATFVVEAGQTTPVSVLLQCDDTSPDTGNVTITGTFNVCPRIRTASASPTTQAVGSSISLSASATDKDSDALTYSWFVGTTYSAGAVFASGESASYVCTAPGTFQLNVRVYDGDARGCSKVLTTPLSVTCTGAVEVDSGTVEVDSGTVEVDSGVVEVDSGVVEVDSGVVEVDSGVVEVDSSVPPVDSGTGSSWPLGSAACVSCQQANCTSYTPDALPVLADCADSACRAIVACELENNCFTNMQEVLLCYCGGAGTAGIDACFASGFVPSGPCRALTEESLQTTDVGLVLERFVDPTYPAGRANQLTTCIGELCATECL